MPGRKKSFNETWNQATYANGSMITFYYVFLFASHFTVSQTNDALSEGYSFLSSEKPVGFFYISPYAKKNGLQK
jgi:hypothetical protein